jgi:hypothetical protein
MYDRIIYLGTPKLKMFAMDQPNHTISTSAVKYSTECSIDQKTVAVNTGRGLTCIGEAEFIYNMKSKDRSFP